MKVCDLHPAEKAIDTIVVENDGARIDVCDVCKYAVLAMFSGEKPPDKPEQRTLLQRLIKN